MMLRFHGVTLAVDVERPCDAAWVREFLVPPASIVAAAEGIAPDLRVRLRVDPVRQAALLASPRRARAREACVFVQDSGVVEHAAWREVGGDIVVHDEEYGCCYVRDRRDGAVDIVYDRQTDWARIALMRVMRELAIARASTAAGVLLLHAAVVVRAGRAILIAGAKRSGKTSLLLHLLTARGTALCANDRCLVVTDAEPPGVAAVPTVVSIRPGSLAQLDRDRALRQTGDSPACLTLEQWLGLPSLRGPAPETPLLLSPSQFAELTDRLRVGDAPLEAIVFPTIDPEVSGFVLHRLDPPGVARRLQANLFSALTPPRTISVLSAARADQLPDAQDRSRRCATLAARAPGIECRLGPDAYDDRGARRLFSALEEACALPT